MARLPKSYLVCKDSREQHGWDFEKEEEQQGKIVCGGMIREYIEEADYTIQGFEDKIRIERKNGFSELFGNYTPKENKERFEREMDRLRKIPHKYLLIETNLCKDTLGLSIPQLYKGLPANAILKWLNYLELEYDIHVQFVGDAGKKVAKNIFEQIVRRYS